MHASSAQGIEAGLFCTSHRFSWFSILCFDILSLADSKGTAVSQASQLPEMAKVMPTWMPGIYKPTKSSVVSTASHMEFSYLEPTPPPLSHGLIPDTDILSIQGYICFPCLPATKELLPTFPSSIPLDCPWCLPVHPIGICDCSRFLFTDCCLPMCCLATPE